jgi:hypothetical protein
MEAMDTIALNNNAVDLMQQGYLQEVTSIFRSALAKLHCLDQHDDVDLADIMTPTFLSVRSVPMAHSLFNASSDPDHHHAFSLFDRALVIDDAELAAASSIAGKDCSAAVVLFNTGLAFHLQGRQDIRSQQTSFKNAFRFYKMAFGILERCSESEYHEVNQLVYLAVMNNMGHIYSHFCEGREAQHCLQLLQIKLETMRSSGIDILSDEYLSFSMNVLILLGGQEIAAAAAAA